MFYMFLYSKVTSANIHWLYSNSNLLIHTYV